MFRLGLASVLVGILSFVLPLFGRQFSLVGVLGVTGMGSSAAGLIFIVVGVLMLKSSLSDPSEGEHSSRLVPTPQEELKRESLFSDRDDGVLITQKTIDAAAAGDVDAQFLLGSAYLHGSNGKPQNFSMAFGFLQMAAKQGHGFAAFVVAGLYADGLGPPQDLEKARLWAMSAQAKGVKGADEMRAAIEAKQAR